MLVEYNHWDVYAGASEGSGRSDKVWLINPHTQEIVLFKFTKTDKTTERISEKLASELAGLIGNVTEYNLQKIISNYTDELLSKKRKLLIKKFLLEKINLMNQVFLREEE